MRINERGFNGHVISWIKEKISRGETIFQDATNDVGINCSGETTKYPDVLLFIEKAAGVVFNGWELKFPNTDVDDIDMLKNALEKARILKSSSFVTWNGSSAIIWGFARNDYSLTGLMRLKEFPEVPEIRTREDLSTPSKYQQNEPKLKSRLSEILSALESLYKNGVIKEAINISTEIVDAVRDCGNVIIPKLTEKIVELKKTNSQFRKEFNKWLILENSTLNILRSSSSRVENIQPEGVLSKFTFYKLIGKTIFYQSLVDNFGNEISPLHIETHKNIKSCLDQTYLLAKKIDYQSVFDDDFTDAIEFDEIMEKALFELVKIIQFFDFRILPNEVIGNILQNLVPPLERKKFGQYFTPELLAYLVAFPAINSKDSLVFDPTSGTGTFLDVAYKIKKYFGCTAHQELLSKIWGNDISHFPAELSVINLHKQNVRDVTTFPRVLRKDFFRLTPHQMTQIPDNRDKTQENLCRIPVFDTIISNFPFIQQEDIPNEELNQKFYNVFGLTQEAFITQTGFTVNERSDYYVYCFYHSHIFLKPNGMIGAITSNAWLGKEYGLQFKKFLLDNYSIRFIVRSISENWFEDSKVNTVYLVLQKCLDDAPTKFITFNKKLGDIFDLKSTTFLSDLEEFYSNLELMEPSINTNWINDQEYPNTYRFADNSIRVSIIPRKTLLNSITEMKNWNQFFISQEPLSIFENSMINPFGSYIDSGRGTRTGQDNMFIVSQREITEYGIENLFLRPIIKSSTELLSIRKQEYTNEYFFVCDEKLEDLQTRYPGAYSWIQRWKNRTNKKGRLLSDVLKDKKPFWYSLRTEEPANIFISINPYEKLFFGFSAESVFLNQRLVAIRTKNEDTILIAALLNSIPTLLSVELNGIGRSLGALDLNANFFKTKIKMLNPALLDSSSKEKIIEKFLIIVDRPVETYDTEFKRPDRIEFDQEVLKSFGFKIDLLDSLYQLLTVSINHRVTLKDK